MTIKQCKHENTYHGVIDSLIRVSPYLENLEYLEKSGNFKRPLENLKLSGNFILNDISQGNLKVSELLYLYIRKESYFFSESSQMEKHELSIIFFYFTTFLSKKSHFYDHILASILNYIYCINLKDICKYFMKITH